MALEPDEPDEPDADVKDEAAFQEGLEVFGIACGAGAVGAIFLFAFTKIRDWLG